MADIQSHSSVTVLDLTNYWCRTLGIHSKDLGCGVKHTDKGIIIDNQASHPQIDDVILMIKFIKEFKSFFNNNDRIASFIIWDWCYNKRLPLKKRHFKKLLNIGNRARRKRFFRQAQKRQSSQY